MRETPVPDAWYGAYKHGNVHYPQTVFGISILTGREILSSLQNESVDMGYVASSQLTDQQVADLTDATVRIHRAHGIRKMPEGYAVREKDREFSANESFREKLWGGVKRRVLRSVVYLSSEDRPGRNSLLDDFGRTSFSTEEGEKLKKEITVFQSNFEYKQTLLVVRDFYDTAAKVLETEEALDIATKRRNSFNVKKDSEIDPIDGIVEIKGMCKSVLDKRFGDSSILREKVQPFVSLNFWSNYMLRPS